MAVYELLDVYQDEYEKNVTLPFPPNRYVDLDESYYGDGYEFLKNFDGLDDFDIQGIELRFVEPLDDFEYTGVIDLVYKDEDSNLVVQDWKSKAKFANKKERAVYARQPFSYALHIKHKFNQDPNILRFFMFRKQNIVDIPFTENGYEEALGWIRSSVKEIKECKEWSATPDPFFCANLCDHRETCQHRG